MASNQYLVSSSRAGLGSVVATRDFTSTQAYMLSNVGAMSTPIALGAAQMDGVASVDPVGSALAMTAARMDGVALLEAFSVLTDPGAAQMDGQSTMLADGLVMAVGTAMMDGLAQVDATSIDMVKGAAQMDGVGRLDGISVEGAGVAYMDGVGSFDAIAPVIHIAHLLENLIGSDALSPLMTYKRVLSQAFVGGELMKPKMRYHMVSSNTINWSSTTSFRMKFIKVLKDVTIKLTSSLEPHSQFNFDLTTSISVQPTLTPEWHALLVLTQNLHVSATTSDKFIWGRVLAQALKVSASLDAHALYKAALTQLFKIIELEAFKLRHPVALNQNINLSSSLIGALALKLLQKFKITTTALPGFSYHLSLVGNVVLRDTLEHLVDAVLEQLFTVHDAPDRQYIAKNALAQVLTIHPALTNKLVLKIVGNILLSPDQLVSMIYRGDELLDGIEITALFISPSGTTTTWAVNTRTQAVTEYTNYNFHSFTNMGNRYIAAGAEGLYELDGDTDAGALVISRLMSGYLQLNEKKLFGIKGAYVAIRGGGRFYLRLVAGDGREYVYELKAQPNLMTTKVKIGKGISTTYMAFELVTEGQDFDLDSVEFIPMTRGRRV
jgi:hypothetical protein